MHVLLLLASLLLVVGGGYGALSSLRDLEGWPARRRLQLAVLAAPVFSLAVGSAGLYHNAGRICPLGAPPWDYALGLVAPIVMGVIAVGALGLGLVRFGLMFWTVKRRTVGAAPELQRLADRLAERLGVPRPRLLLWASDRPLAFTCGLRRPTVLLSMWMPKNLDAREMESVVAHELGHAARHDYVVIWLAVVLRDSFFYLPTSWTAYRQLQADKEFACDDLAVSVTEHPLALASALAKVWQQSIAGSPLSMAQTFAQPQLWIEQRIERLIEDSSPDPRTCPTRVSQGNLACIGAPALAGLLALQAAVLIVMLLHPLSCGPVSLLGKMV